MRQVSVTDPVRKGKDGSPTAQLGIARVSRKPRPPSAAGPSCRPGLLPRCLQGEEGNRSAPHRSGPPACEVRGQAEAPGAGTMSGALAPWGFASVPETREPLLLGQTPPCCLWGERRLGCAQCSRFPCRGLGDSGGGKRSPSLPPGEADSTRGARVCSS